MAIESCTSCSSASSIANLYSEQLSEQLKERARGIQATAKSVDQQATSPVSASEAINTLGERVGKLIDTAA